MREISSQYFSVWEFANGSFAFFLSLGNEMFYLLPSSHSTVAVLVAVS